MKSPLTLDTILDTLDTLDRDGCDLATSLQNALVPEVIS